MLHHAEHDLVAGADVVEPEARRYEVDRLCRRAREHDLLDRSRIEEPPHALARRLIGIGRGIGEIMQAAMYVGIFVGVEMLTRSITARGFCAEAALSR